MTEVNLFVQLQNIHQNNPVLNRVYYTDGIINDALIIHHTSSEMPQALSEPLNRAQGSNSQSDIALSGLVSPPPTQHLSASLSMGRYLANSQSWCGDTNKINSNKSVTNTYCNQQMISSDFGSFQSKHSAVAAPVESEDFSDVLRLRLERGRGFHHLRALLAQTSQTGPGEPLFGHRHCKLLQ